MRAAFVFWTCLFLIFYVYALYPLILWLAYAACQIRRDLQYLAGRQDRRAAPPEDLPPVSLLIPACNEERHLPAKLANLREMNYPPERLEIIFVSDGSTDETNRILGEAAVPCRTVFLPSRQGKAAALNRAVQEATHDLLVFSDAATLFAPRALRNLVRHFRDPRTGVVCGALQFFRSAESKQTDGIYWKYETILRLMESRLGATLTASGAIYAMRRACFRALAPGTVLDDFVTPFQARVMGYEVKYDPEAVALEYAPDSVGGEFVRRVRLATGSFRALPGLLRSTPGGFFALAFFSHKVLRWFLPFLLIALLMSNLFLLDGLGFQLVLAIQLTLLLLAAAGAIWRGRLQRVPFGLLAYFLSAMNLAFLVGFARSIFAPREATWQRTS